jgi:asparagine synthase (glutamine-hydrolysing)
VNLRLPYADTRVANFAFSLPMTFKIESTSDPLRKRVLRKTAEQVGMPVSIVDKAKKAVQYATGVDKAIRSLAKRENLNTSDYCKKLNENINRRDLSE